MTCMDVIIGTRSVSSRKTPRRPYDPPRVPTRGPTVQCPRSSHGSYANHINNHEELTVLPS